MKRRAGFQKVFKFGILYLANFPLLLSFHESNILIKISLLACFRQEKREGTSPPSNLSRISFRKPY